MTLKWRGRGARNGKLLVKTYDQAGNLISRESLRRAPKPELANGANPFVSHDLTHDYFFDIPKDDARITKHNSRPPPASH